MEPFLIEATGHLGGLIRSERVSEFVVEAGPDSFLTLKAEGITLAKELGLGPALIGSNDSSRRTYILRRNRLVPLPADFHLFVPRRLGSALNSPLLPLFSRLAAACERYRSRSFKRQKRSDEPVSEFVRRHFGAGMVENIAEPLMAGIYGGDVARLSVRSALPGIFAIEQQYGSLIRGVAKTNSTREGAGPVFMTLKEGMKQLVDSLVASLKGPDDGRLRIYTGSRASVIEAGSCLTSDSARPPATAYAIRTQTGQSMEADAVILALPAFESAKVLHSINPGLASELAAIPYTSAAIVTLGYTTDLAKLPPGFGFLTPAKSGRRVRACTFVHSKFPFRAPEPGALLRCFLGGARDASVVEESDEELTSVVVQELKEVLGIRTLPSFTRVYRWPQAMPQYVVGHEARISRISAALEKQPGVFLAGNAYSGVGLSDCIRTAKEAAERVLALSRVSNL